MRPGRPGALGHLGRCPGSLPCQGRRVWCSGVFGKTAYYDLSRGRQNRSFLLGLPGLLYMYPYFEQSLVTGRRFFPQV